MTYNVNMDVTQYRVLCGTPEQAVKKFWACHTVVVGAAADVSSVIRWPCYAPRGHHQRFFGRRRCNPLVMQAIVSRA